MKRAVPSRSGSTPGFSQPLSGFLARLSFAVLFRTATVPGILEQLWTPFSRTEARFPVVLDSAQQNRFVLPASPTSKLLSPHESVRDQSELPRPGGRYSFGLFLSRVFSAHASRSQTRPGLADLNPSLRPKTLGPRPSRPAASRTG
jgi:hypothetical protein